MPEGYSKINISYLICLSIDGELKDIIPYFKTVEIKGKEIQRPIEEIFPERVSTPKIESYFLEHRPTYIFGLEVIKRNNELTLDVTDKSEKSFNSFVEVNSVLQEIDSPLAKAIYNFLMRWIPANEITNSILLSKIKDIQGSYFCFCLEDDITLLAHKDTEILKKWEETFRTQDNDNITDYCSVCGEYLPIARIHDNLKGIKGAQSAGANIVCCKEDSGESYCKTQGMIASISFKVMKQYTSAFNYLSDSRNNKYVLGDMTLLFWAETSEKSEIYEEIFAYINGFGFQTKDNASDNIKACLMNFAHGKMPDIDAMGLNADTKFYILGVKPNSSRLSIKLFLCNTFGNILNNVQKHIQGIKLYEAQERIPKIYQILMETISPKTKDKPNPALESQLIINVIKGTMYPDNLLASLISRIKTDQDEEKNKFVKINEIRVGMIKEYLNRKQKITGKGEIITMALNNETKDPAYLCGRMFAILEKLQSDAIGNVNAGLKAKYFGSACSTPAMVFPRLIKLAQNHIAKLDNGFYLESKISEIINNIEGDFPKTLSIEEQGRFVLGYYQQNKDLYTKKGEKKNEENQ